MAAVTIGVPVYNGAQCLDECLACLARQTFLDLKVLIFDNASTDRTAEIARDWTVRDSRFHYFRQPTNIGGLANFSAVLQAAESPWFLWRADDDLSDDNYIEMLYEIASPSPNCKLAVGNVLSQDLDGGHRQLFLANRGNGDLRADEGRIRMLFAYHPSWVYGLWDRETLLAAFLPVQTNYPFAYATDHLTLYGPIIDGVVRTTTRTKFIQRRRQAGSDAKRSTRMRFSIMVETRRKFRHELRRVRSERDLSLAVRSALVTVEPLYLERTVPSLLKMARTGFRELFGIAGSKKQGRHFEREPRPGQNADQLQRRPSER